MTLPHPLRSTPVRALLSMGAVWERPMGEGKKVPEFCEDSAFVIKARVKEHAIVKAILQGKLRLQDIKWVTQVGIYT